MVAGGGQDCFLLCLHVGSSVVCRSFVVAAAEPFSAFFSQKYRCNVAICYSTMCKTVTEYLQEPSELSGEACHMKPCNSKSLVKIISWEGQPPPKSCDTFNWRINLTP